MYQETSQLLRYSISFWCKKDKYLVNLTPKKSVTLLRQLIRPYNYKLIAKEKYSRGTKYLLYNLEKIDENISIEYDLTLKFD